MPALIGTLISAKMATLHELDSIYGVKDAYDMSEILIVDMHNNRVVDAYNQRKWQR